VVGGHLSGGWEDLHHKTLVVCGDQRCKTWSEMTERTSTLVSRLAPSTAGLKLPIVSFD
jgi:hypothetical protein